MKIKSLSVLFLVFSVNALMAQTKVGDKWVDNNLSFKVIYDNVKANGRLDICLADTSRDACIENLQSGFELWIYNSQDELLWNGIGSGRTYSVKLPKAYPQASYIKIKAFKPYVTNRISRGRIHQDKPIEIKYNLK